MELARDQIIENFAILAVSYFCVGTEMRFLHNSKSKEEYDIKDSEMYHAKSL